ncbi:MAG: hypothetical protein ACYCPN_06645 [Thermoplasmata archaeon]
MIGGSSDSGRGPAIGPGAGSKRASGGAPFQAPPRSLPELIPWFEAFSRELVRLSDPSVDEIRAGIDALETALRVELPFPPPSGAGKCDADLWDESLVQLRWLLGIVEQDDHGGNRQALGQYGLLVAESLREHLLPPDPTDRWPDPTLPEPTLRRRGDVPRRNARPGAGGNLKRAAGPGAPP